MAVFHAQVQRHAVLPWCLVQERVRKASLAQVAGAAMAGCCLGISDRTLHVGQCFTIEIELEPCLTASPDVRCAPHVALAKATQAIMKDSLCWAVRCASEGAVANAHRQHQKLEPRAFAKRLRNKDPLSACLALCGSSKSQASNRGPRPTVSTWIPGQGLGPPKNSLHAKSCGLCGLVGAI